MEKQQYDNPNPIMTEYRDLRNPPLISNEFKQAFNELMVEINRRQDAEGKFRLHHGLDNTKYEVVKAAIKLCKQYCEDQQSTIEGDPYFASNFMNLCDVER